MKTSNLTIQKHLTYRGVKYNPNKISRDNQESHLAILEYIRG